MEEKARKNNTTITVYTDGGCRNTGVQKSGHVNSTDKAAWAFRIDWFANANERAINGRYADCGGKYGATNNQLELTALVKALEELIDLEQDEDIPINSATDEIRFFLDSQYVINGVKNIKSWKAKGWRNSQGPVKNLELWKKIDTLLPHFPHCSFNWVKGHADNEGNNWVDQELNRYMDVEMK